MRIFYFIANIHIIRHCTEVGVLEVFDPEEDELVLTEAVVGGLYPGDAFLAGGQASLVRRGVWGCKELPTLGRSPRMAAVAPH